MKFFFLVISCSYGSRVFHSITQDLTLLDTSHILRLETQGPRGGSFLPFNLKNHQVFRFKCLSIKGLQSIYSWIGQMDPPTHPRDRSFSDFEIYFLLFGELSTLLLLAGVVSCNSCQPVSDNRFFEFDITLTILFADCSQNWISNKMITTHC